MGYWDDIIKYGLAGAGGVGGFLMGGPQGALMGAGLGYGIGGDIGQAVAPDRPALATRPSLGAEGKAAMSQQSRAIQSMMNQQLMQTTIPMINREYAGAGRYASGQRLGAIERATGQAQGMAGGLARQGAMDLYLAQLRAVEERQWRQAQLDLASQDDSMWSDVGQYLPYLLQLYQQQKTQGV